MSAILIKKMYTKICKFTFTNPISLKVTFNVKKSDIIMIFHLF